MPFGNNSYDDDYESQMSSVTVNNNLSQRKRHDWENEPPPQKLVSKQRAREIEIVKSGGPPVSHQKILKSMSLGNRKRRVPQKSLTKPSRPKTKLERQINRQQRNNVNTQQTNTPVIYSSMPNGAKPYDDIHMTNGKRRIPQERIESDRLQARRQIESKEALKAIELEKRRLQATQTQLNHQGRQAIPSRAEASRKAIIQNPQQQAYKAARSNQSSAIVQEKIYVRSPQEEEQIRNIQYRQKENIQNVPESSVIPKDQMVQNNLFRREQEEQKLELKRQKQENQQQKALYERKTKEIASKYDELLKTTTKKDKQIDNLQSQLKAITDSMEKLIKTQSKRVEKSMLKVAPIPYQPLNTTEAELDAKNKEEIEKIIEEEEVRAKQQVKSILDAELDLKRKLEEEKIRQQQQKDEAIRIQKQKQQEDEKRKIKEEQARKAKQLEETKKNRTAEVKANNEKAKKAKKEEQLKKIKDEAEKKAREEAEHLKKLEYDAKVAAQTKVIAEQRAKIKAETTELEEKKLKESIRKEEEIHNLAEKRKKLEEQKAKLKELKEKNSTSKSPIDDNNKTKPTSKPKPKPKPKSKIIKIDEKKTKDDKDKVKIEVKVKQSDDTKTEVPIMRQSSRIKRLKQINP